MWFDSCFRIGVAETLDYKFNTFCDIGNQNLFADVENSVKFAIVQIINKYAAVPSNNPAICGICGYESAMVVARRIKVKQ